jgi:hypothetical protein
MSNFDSFTQNEILQAIDFFQDEYYGHPLTCDNDSQNHELLRGKKGDDGVVRLVCPSCDYVQTYIPDYVMAVWDSREEYRLHVQKAREQYHESIYQVKEGSRLDRDSRPQ